MLCLILLTCLSARETREGSWKSRFKTYFESINSLILPPYINCIDINLNLFFYHFQNLELLGIANSQDDASPVEKEAI